MFAAFQSRFARWTEDTTVMPSFYEAVPLELRQMMLENLQTGLETSSTVWTTSEAEEFGAELVDSATHTDSNDRIFALAGSKTAALSYLLYDGQYATPFLTAVGAGLD